MYIYIYIYIYIVYITLKVKVVKLAECMTHFDYLITNILTSLTFRLNYPHPFFFA